MDFDLLLFVDTHDASEIRDSIEKYVGLLLLHHFLAGLLASLLPRSIIV